MNRKQFIIYCVGVALCLAFAGCGTFEDSEYDFITFSNIDKAWQYTKGGGAVVAVADWLFDMSPAASEKYIFPTSMVPGQPVGSGEPWHGEWMAEIVHRIAPEAKIIPIRARPDDSDSYETYIPEAIRFAADHGAVAVSSSLGMLRQTPELLDAINYAETKGTAFINVHPEYLERIGTKYTEAPPDLICGKIIHAGIVAVRNHPVRPERNRDIYTWPYDMDPVFRDGWGYSNGPAIIAGVAALMKSVNPKITPPELKRIMRETAMMRKGFRILDAEAAVKAAIAAGK